MKKTLYKSLLLFFVLILLGGGFSLASDKTNPAVKRGKGCAKEGETAKSGKNLVCCEGLKYFKNYIEFYGPYTGRDGKEFYKKEFECNGLGDDIGGGDSRSMEGHHICINCGNGVCGIGENKCNCPQDCDKAGCVVEGGVFFPNDGGKCCAGLRAEWSYKRLEDGDCKKIHGKLGHQRICVKCRDGVCGKGENGCNCPQDCKDFKCKKAGEIPSYTAFGDDMSIQCCAGLKHRAQKYSYGENCEARLHGGYSGICLSCGDGKCDSQFENKCNCPEDCK